MRPDTGPDLLLNDGTRMPRLGLGVFQVGDDEAEAAVATALACGYRSVDTAALYGNERGVGAAVRSSGIPREQVFVTTKLWNSTHGADGPALDRSLDKLGLDHVPDPPRARCAAATAGSCPPGLGSAGAPGGRDPSTARRSRCAASAAAGRRSCNGRWSSAVGSRAPASRTPTRDPEGRGAP